MSRNGNPLSARKRRFIREMLTAHSIEAAALSAGISPRTGYRYLTQSVVKRALSAALDTALSQATARAVAALAEALNTLEAIHANADNPPAARVSAARAILDCAPKLRAAGDLSERIEALEEAWQKQ